MRDENPSEMCGSESPVPQSELLEGDVNIQCIQSSEFVVGKQINFNGPVTVINCVDTSSKGSSDDEKKQLGEEKIVIRDKVLWGSTATTGQKVSEKKEKKEKPDEENQAKWRNPANRKLTKFSMVSVLVCVVLVTVAVVALTVFFTWPTAEESSDNANGLHRLYSKKDWGGKPPKSMVEMKLPIPYVVVSHTVTPRCFHLKACAALMQNMQNYHLTLDFADIGYNFLVDSAGNIYEGRGWNRRNVKGGFVNGRNIDVALIGDYSETIFPTEKLMDGLKHLLEFGVENKKISETYSLIAANSTYSTLSPGKQVYAVIKYWPHFDPDPKSHLKEYEE